MQQRRELLYEDAVPLSNKSTESKHPRHNLISSFSLTKYFVLHTRVTSGRKSRGEKRDRDTSLRANVCSDVARTEPPLAPFDASDFIHFTSKRPTETFASHPTSSKSSVPLKRHVVTLKRVSFRFAAIFASWLRD